MMPTLPYSCSLSIVIVMRAQFIMFYSESNDECHNYNCCYLNVTIEI